MSQMEQCITKRMEVLEELIKKGGEGSDSKREYEVGAWRLRGPRSSQTQLTNVANSEITKSCCLLYSNMHLEIVCI